MIIYYVKNRDVVTFLLDHLNIKGLEGKRITRETCVIPEGYTYSEVEKEFAKHHNVAGARFIRVY